MKICLEKAMDPSWLWTHSLNNVTFLYTSSMLPLLILGEYLLAGHILRYALASQIGFSCMSLARIFWQLISVPHRYFQLSCTSLNSDSWWSCILLPWFLFLGPPPPTTGPVSPNFKNHLSELDETFSVISPLMLWSLTKEQQGEFGEINETW